MIVHENGPVTLIGGAELRQGALDRVTKIAPVVVAADGGADRALDLGVVPSAVIGDFDSISPDALARIPKERLHRVPEQETTDFDKALSRIAAPVVVGLGFTGDRLDHQLAALNTLMRHADRPCVLVGSEDVTFLCPPRFALDLPAGETVSLFPMAPMRVRSEGLEWPTDDLVLSPLDRVGTSNRATGPIVLTPQAPTLLAILPLRWLESVVQTLLHAPSGWPVPAGQ